MRKLCVWMTWAFCIALCFAFPMVGLCIITILIVVTLVIFILAEKEANG